MQSLHKSYSLHINDIYSFRWGVGDIVSLITSHDVTFIHYNFTKSKGTSDDIRHGVTQCDLFIMTVASFSKTMAHKPRIM